MLENLKDKLRNEICSKDKKYYFFDYDGTLIKHQDNYEEMYLEKEILKLLQQINSIENVNIGIVTGRSLEDIKKMAPIENVIYATNHGYLIEKNGKIIKEHNDFNNDDYIRKYHEIMEELASYKGITLKLKEACAFIRFKTLPENIKDEFRKKALEIIETKFTSDEIRIRAASNIIEFLPLEITDKGEAIKMVINDSDALVFFAGDDIADEDGFKYVQSIGGITTKVVEGDTMADFTLKSVDEIESLLQFIQMEEERNLRVKSSNC